MYISSICKQIRDSKHLLGKQPRVISLIKGVEREGNRIGLVSNTIKNILNLDSISVMMGANIAQEIADLQFSESTIGYENSEDALLFQSLLQTYYFRVNVVQDVPGVELCGGTINVITLQA